MSTESIRSYTALVCVLCLGMVILCVLTAENARMSPKRKKRYFISYGFVIASIVTEWASIRLNGAPAGTAPLHRVVRALYYIVSPAIGLAYVHQLEVDTEKNPIRSGVSWLLVANTALALVSIFTGWAFKVDEANTYRHGAAYPVFLGTRLISITYTLYGFLQYRRKYARKNYVSLMMILVMTYGTLIAEEFLGEDAHLYCVGLALTSCLLYVHFNEFTQMEQDSALKENEELLNHDALTGLWSRYAYAEAMNDLKCRGMSPDTVIVAMDVTGMKSTNDSLGHAAGDELLRTSAELAARAFEPFGRVYRTGGDEFVAVLEGAQDNINLAVQQLQDDFDAWKTKKRQGNIQLAIGMAAACDLPGQSVERLNSLADTRMYVNKEAFYLENDLTRY